MTFDETEKHIETEVSGICNDIIDLYCDILGRDADEFGRDHPFFLNEKKRLNNERDELCKRVKELGQLALVANQALGQLAMVANQTKDNYITVTSAQSPEFGIGEYRRVCGDGTLEK